MLSPLVIYIKRHIPQRNKVMEVRKEQTKSICMVKGMEEEQSLTSSHKTIKEKEQIIAEIRAKL